MGGHIGHMVSVVERLESDASKLEFIATLFLECFLMLM